MLPWPKFPNLRVDLPMNHLSMIPSFLLLQFVFFMHAKAQNYADSTDGNSIGNFQPSLAVVIGLLSVMFALTFILLLYAKYCHQASSVDNTSQQQIQDGLVLARSGPSGVDKKIVESLPFFRFSSLRGWKAGLECAVCLAKFEDIEILRLLPKCKHAFHIDCIDQWLEKHSTCPLCRRKVSADDLSQLPYSNSLRFLWNKSELREESNIELYVQREEENNCHGSSRFSIGSSFRNVKEEELTIQESNTDYSDGLHRFNHKIVVSDVVLKNRWSNVSSSDLMFLNSEMLIDASSARFSSLDCSRNEQKSTDTIKENDGMMNVKEEMERKRVFESKLRREIIQLSDQNYVPLPATSESRQQNYGFGSKALNSNEKRSMSEIIVHPRFTELIRNNKDPSNTADIANVKEERRRRIWLPIARKTVQWFANRERRPPQSQGINLHTLNV